MPTAHRGLPERAGPTGPTLPGPAVTLAATTAIQVMAALAALSVPAIAPAIAAATGPPASQVGTYISLVYLCAAAVQPLRAVLDHDRDPGARFTGSALLSGVRLVGASGPLRSMAALSFVYSGLQNCTSSFIVAYLVEELGYGWIAAGIGLTAA